MTDSHTCAVGGVNLVVAVILVSCSELIELTGDLVSGASVSIPIGIYTVGVVDGGRRRLLLWWAGEGSVEALVAAQDGVAFLSAELASWTISIVLATIATIVAAPTTTCSSAASSATLEASDHLVWPSSPKIQNLLQGDPSAAPSS